MSTPDPAGAPAAPKHLGPIRRLYAWVLHWAETPYALPALFFLSFIESSFFPIPPDVLLMALCMGNPQRSMVFALWCSIASVLGGVLGYAIGYAVEPLGRWIIFDLLHYGAAWDTVASLYADNAFLAIVTAAFTPIPYKVFTIAAGVFHEQVSLATLIAASAIGRSGRFFLVAGTIQIFGPMVKVYLDRYLEWATVLLTILAIGGFVAVKYLI
jgi:membrane protein YqaA with SNARE-associated domain